MRVFISIVCVFVMGCAIQPKRATMRPTTAPSVVVEPKWADLDVHARTCLFSGKKLPEIVVQWRGDPHRCAGPFRVKTTYYDAKYAEVETAQQPGRYGAIVEITTASGHLMRHFLSLYRFADHVDWDYVRLPTTIEFAKPFGIDNAAMREQHANFSEFIKYMIQRDAERCSQPAMILAGLHEAKPAGDAFVARNGFEALDEKWWTGLKQKLGLPNLPYLIHLPADYEQRPGERFPTILFLHGSGEAGNGDEQLAKVNNAGLAGMLAKGEGLPKDFPFIVISPQCPTDADWSPYDLERLMGEVEKKYRVDVEREYLTGLSLGGYGSWDMAMAFPKRFAAVAPCSGAGDVNDVMRIKDIPVWIFHGEKDGVVPVEEARSMYAALKKVGGRVKMTIYPELGHSAWNPAYRDPALYEWMLEHKRSPRSHEDTKEHEEK